MTVHYYVEDSAGVISHEYQPTLVVEKYTQNNADNYKLKDADGNEKHFNSKGQLYKLVDSKGNAQSYTFDGNRITEVTDPVGRKVTLTYSNVGLLTSITDSRGRVTRYTYIGRDENAKLDTVIPPERINTRFSIADENGISIKNSTGVSELIAVCDTQPLRGTRVTKIITRTGTSVTLDTTIFKYTDDIFNRATGKTVVAKFNGNADIDTNVELSKDLNSYLFDNLGRVISVTNKENKTKYAVYGSDAVGESASFNKLTDSSELLTIADNMLKDHGFEYSSSVWLNNSQSATSGTIELSSDEHVNGNKSLMLNSTANNETLKEYQNITLEGGETYTLSMDVYVPEELALTNENGACFGLAYSINGVSKTDCCQWIASTSGWERFSKTVTIPEGTVTNANAFMQITNVVGKVYFDNVQLEKSGGARQYNLIENSDFSNYTGKNAYAWTMNNTQEDVDGVIYRNSLNKPVVSLSGVPDYDKEIYQEVNVDAQAGQMLIIGGKAAANAVEGEDTESYFDICAVLTYKDTTDVGTYYINFDRNVVDERQVVATYINLDKDCEKVKFYFRYHSQMNSVDFDNAFIYVCGYGEHYQYTDDGLMSQTSNDEGKTIDYDYKINDSTKLDNVTQTVSGVTQPIAEDIQYEGNEIKSLVNNQGSQLLYEITPISETNNNAKIETVKMTTPDDETREISKTIYTDDGNYVASTTDYDGGTTQYTYDVENNVVVSGLVKSVIDANGNETTYTYDSYTDELKSVNGKAVNEDAAPSSTVHFGYEDNKLMWISKDGTNYRYEYDTFDRLIKLSVANYANQLINTYDSQGRLTSVEYGNYDKYSLLYDDQDRLSGEKWNDTQTSEYYYNENNRVSKFVDKTTGISYQYDYAFYNLPFKTTGSDGTVTKYDYDRSGILSHLTFTKNNDKIYSARYKTNNKGLPEDTTIETLDNDLIHYNYDDFNRLESQSNSAVVSYFTYEAGKVGNISEYRNEKRNGDLIHKSVYAYDDANISAISGQYLTAGTNGTLVNYSSTYTYDGLNRLITETNSQGTYNYVYDPQGNITSITRGTENPTTIHSYSYDFNGWGDLLTSIDGKAITYDFVGNPLTFDGYTFQWSRGKLLTRFSGNGKDIQYVYDAAGKRIRQIVNGLEINYLYSGDLLIRQTYGDNTIDFQYDSARTPVGFNYNGTPYFYVYNALGDVVAVVNKAGDVEATYTYDSYGNILSYTGAMASINPIRYRGYYQDPETGWYYLKTRYYNPDWRRFINADAAFVAGGDVINGSNMFAYCNNNPVMYFDSEGESASSIRYRLIKVIDLLTPKSIKQKVETYNEKAGAVSQKASSGVGEVIGDALAGVSVKGSDFAAENIDTSNWFAWAEIPDKLDPKREHRLRNIFPNKIMYFGAGIGAWALDFHKNRNIFDVNYGNYTTLPNSTQWQSRVGYFWIYDVAFSVGGPTEVRKYPFKKTVNGKTVCFIVWCWKADYWNLGAGAEIGIYYTDKESYADRGYYKIGSGVYDEETNPNSVDLKVIVEMDVTYEGTPITENFVQKNWWVTSFTPRIQSPDIDKLFVDLKVKFAEGTYTGLMKPFYETFYNKRGIGELGEGISWAQTSRKKLYTGHTHYCNSEVPVVCTCTCSKCPNPCTYNSDFGDKNSRDLLGNEGYQFYINF